MNQGFISNEELENNQKEHKFKLIMDSQGLSIKDSRTMTKMINRFFYLDALR